MTMRSLALTSCAAAALACAGCPGTIEDPSSFRAYQEAHAGDGGDAESPQDAGSEPSDAAMAQDATPSVMNDASGEGSDAGHDAGHDAEATDSGREQPVDAGETKADAAALCDFKALMQTKCGTAACHGGPDSSTILDLVSDGLAARLQGMPGSDSCSTNLMIDPANPAQSVLYLRVSGTSCGVRMPLGGTALSGDEQACVLSWIDQL